MYLILERFRRDNENVQIMYICGGNWMYTTFGLRTITDESRDS